MNRCVTIAALAAACSSAPALAGSLDFFTDFEFTDTSGFFELGVSPNSVAFIDGEAKSIGAPLLYTSGLNAWMINPGDTGEIVFETHAGTVDLWFRDQSTQASSTLTFFAPDDSVIAEFTGSAFSFQHIVLSGMGPIARITLTNPAEFGYSVIDDFGFSAIPSPAGVAIFGLAGLASIRRRRG